MSLILNVFVEFTFVAVIKVFSITNMIVKFKRILVYVSRIFRYVASRFVSIWQREKGMTDDERQQQLNSNIREMESLAKQLMEAITTQPPKDLLGYIYAQLILVSARDESDACVEELHSMQKSSLDEIQFLLEYVHAALAVHTDGDCGDFREEVCEEIFNLATQLKEVAMMFAMLSASGTTEVSA